MWTILMYHLKHLENIIEKKHFYAFSCWNNLFFYTVFFDRKGCVNIGPSEHCLQFELSKFEIILFMESQKTKDKILEFGETFVIM